MTRRGVLVGIVLVAIARPALATCPGRPSFQPIPTLHAHVGLPVDYQARLREYCGISQFSVLEGPANFQIDQAGGRFYWTPAAPGKMRITIQVSQTAGGVVTSRTKRFRAVVDDDTLTYPLFRDYLPQARSVPITGRTHGRYTLEYVDVTVPDVRHLIAGPITTPVESTGLLASWDIAALPDGGRYLLRLTTIDHRRSVLTNPVIIDRSAKTGCRSLPSDPVAR